jgi:hypothetical protein
VQPLCLVLEDVHWADDALLDLVEALARRAQAAPLLVLTLARPELVERRTSWGGGLPSFTSITLQPLDVPTTRTLVGELGRAHALTDAGPHRHQRAVGREPAVRRGARGDRGRGRAGPKACPAA